MNERAQRNVDTVLLVTSAVLLFLVWEAGVRVFDVSRNVLPAPSSIVTTLWRMVQIGTLWGHIRVTLVETIAGFVIGSLAGIALGTVIALSRLLNRVLYPYIIVLQVIPKVAIAPLLVIWFGFGIESKIAIAVLISFFPLLVNTIAGLQNIDQSYLDLMTAMTADRFQTFRYVRFPGALPFIFAGLETGIVLSIIGAIVGEFVGSSNGLGYLIMLHLANLNVPGVFAVLVVLALIGIILHALIGVMERRIVFWTSVEQERFAGA